MPTAARRAHREGLEFSPEARALLERYDYPGNVRELENIIERSVALATRPVIGLDDLPLELAMNEVAPARGEGEAGPPTLREARDRFDKAATRALGAGSFGYWPAGTRHFAWMEGETILQLHGQGPWTVTYVNPADDPRKATPR